MGSYALFNKRSHMNHSYIQYIMNRKEVLSIKKKILLFGDPGIDDSLALMYCLLDPHIELVGIVASYGNVPKEQATANAAYLMQLAGRNNIPVISGASMPINQEQQPFYPEIHGNDGIGSIDIPDNFQYNSILLMQFVPLLKNTGSIVDVGRSTSLATVFMLFPEHIKMVHSFFVMGGAFFMPGNAFPLAEANFFGDPVSANFVLQEAHNLTITPLNATQYAVLTPEIVEAVSQSDHNVFAFMMKPIFDYYNAYYQKTTPGIPGAPIHDLLTVMVVNNPAMVDTIS